MKTYIDRQSAAYRWQVAGRVLLASVGGYLVSNLLVIALSFFLPGNQAEAAYTASLLAFLVWVGLVLWVFSCASLRKALINLSALGLVGGLLVTLFWWMEL